MNARRKLNVAAVNGALLVAVLVGTASQSPWAFLVTAAVLVGLSVWAGSIRLGSKDGRRRS